MKILDLISAVTPAAALACAFTSAALASSAYTCTTFQYDSADSTFVSGINNAGDVVGSWSNNGGSPHAFLRRSDGTFISLSDPNGSDDFTPVGINNLGQIAGPNFILNPDGSYIDVPPPVAPQGHTYYGVSFTGFNDNGELVGWELADFNGGTGTVLIMIRGKDGQYRIIDQSGTGSEPSLYSGAINNADVVVEHTRYTDGYLLYPDGKRMALTLPGVPSDVSSPGGASSTSGLNNKNTTTAFTFQGPAYGIAFIRTPDGHDPLITCPEQTNPLTTRGINDENVVAGNYFGQGASGTNQQLGFIATPTGLYPRVQLSNLSWSFATHSLGDNSATGTVYISNNGPADLHIPTLYIGNTGATADSPRSFQIIHSNCAPVPGGPAPLADIPPGGWCFVQFQFTPAIPGWQTAALYIPDDATDAPQTVKLGGTGVGGMLQLSNRSWTFAAHPVGQASGAGVIYIYNQGPGVVTFNSTRIVENGGSPLDFFLLNNTCGNALSPYRTCAITFNFDPTSAGLKTAAINLNDNSTGGPIAIPIYGVGH